MLLRPLPFPGADDLVLVTDTNRQTRQNNFDASPANFLDWRERQTTLHRDGGVPPGVVCIVRRRSPGERRRRDRQRHLLRHPRGEAGRSAAASPRPMARRVPSASPSSATHCGASASARRADVIGRPVRLNDEPHAIVGVMPPGIEYPGQGARVGAAALACPGRPAGARRRPVDAARPRLLLGARAFATRPDDRERAGRHGHGRRVARARLPERQPEPRRDGDAAARRPGVGCPAVGAAPVRRGRPAAAHRRRQRLGPPAGARHGAAPGDGGPHRARGDARPDPLAAADRERGPRHPRRRRRHPARDVADWSAGRAEPRRPRRRRRRDDRCARAALRPRGLDTGGPVLRPRAGAPAHAPRRAPRFEAGCARRQQQGAAAAARRARRGGNRAVAGAARRCRADDSQLRQRAARAGRLRSGSRADADRQPARGPLPDAGAEGRVLGACDRIAAAGAGRRGRRCDQPPAAAARQQHARADASRSRRRMRS